jgi:hypothetical protein
MVDSTESLSIYEHFNRQYYSDFLSAFCKFKTEKTSIETSLDAVDKQYLLLAAFKSFKLGATPENFIIYVQERFLEMNGDYNLYAKSLCGPKIQDLYLTAKSKRNPDDTVKAVNKAKLMKGVLLSEDETYREIKIRMKENSHTKFDVEYAKQRQMEMMNEVKSWVFDKEELLNEN